MSEGAFLIGNGQITRIEGQRGTTPDCPEALFKKTSVVRLRRRKHLSHLPEKGAVVAVVPPGFSPDHALDDLWGRPRRLMHQVPAKKVTYIIAFEGDTKPHLMHERDLIATDDPPAEIGFAASYP